MARYTQITADKHIREKRRRKRAKSKKSLRELRDGTKDYLQRMD